MRTFGMDEPMGCYDDIEQADAFVPGRKHGGDAPDPLVAHHFNGRSLLTRTLPWRCFLNFARHRSFELADNGIIFTPQLTW